MSLSAIRIDNIMPLTWNIKNKWENSKVSIKSDLTDIELC
jgi:hypothetical protein